MDNLQYHFIACRERERRKHVSKDLAMVEGFFNSVMGHGKDSKQELLDKFKFVASLQGTEEYKKVIYLKNILKKEMKKIYEKLN